MAIYGSKIRRDCIMKFAILHISDLHRDLNGRGRNELVVPQNRSLELVAIEPLHVAAYVEGLGKDFEKPTVKQHLAAIRMLFDWLVTGQVVATKLGWHEDAFVFPDGIVPKGWSDVEIYLDDDDADIYRRLRHRGTRAGTMRLFALFAGNSRLMFGAALACVGALSPVIRPEHVAAQLLGEAGDGKTSGAAAISSIWGGDPDPNHRLGSGTSWENTKFALEKYAAAYNNMLLFLDEVDSAEGDDPKTTANSLLKAIKSISGGKGRAGAPIPRYALRTRQS
jgi:hypothetical protein